VDEATFFATPEEFRAWLDAHHDSAAELWVGFRKVGTGRPSITWPQAVDQALCYGWIDGLRKGIDAESYRIRFTPRRPTSIWSAVNVARVEALRAEGLMTPAGLAAYERRRADRTGVYSFERREAAAFTPEQEAEFRADTKAWEYFCAQPPGYRKVATHWVVSAKRAETQARRLATLIADSAAGRRLANLTSPARK
jgi:uncharacterized protein YdeI (YjbR/CyaY-like superfamily)